MYNNNAKCVTIIMFYRDDGNCEEKNVQTEKQSRSGKEREREKINGLNCRQTSNKSVWERKMVCVGITK